MTNKSKDYHFFASDFVADRIDTSHLSNKAPQKEMESVGADDFLPTCEEIRNYKENLKTLLARKLVEHVSSFSWMSCLIPTHVPHDRQVEMSKASSIFLLPIILKNEASYLDCIDIMDAYVKHINQWYAKAGRGSELETLRVPVGGDQLTRVRLQRKALREGTHTMQSRFDQLEPVIVEMFHTLQDFLEKLCKKFLKFDKGMDKGTLGHLKLVIQRSNVNGKVKVLFKAHEQFVAVVGTSYFLQLTKHMFGLKELSDELKHPDIPPKVNLWHNKKEEVFHRIMDQLLDTMFIPPLDKKKKSEAGTCNLTVTVGQTKTKLTVPVVNNQIQVRVGAPGNLFVLTATPTQVEHGVSVPLPGLTTPVLINKDVLMEDDLHNYVVNFMNWYFVILVLQDAISEGNMYLNNITLKFMIPYFYSHSALSKYMSECIDYILKTEIMLSSRMAMRVRAASFVNPTGRHGHNKAADMQKENQVLVLKGLIKGLGANKTERSIVKISKVAPVVESINDNVVSMTKSADYHTSHRQRSSSDDIKEILSVLQASNPWKVTPGRQLKGFQGISQSPFSFNVQQMRNSIQTNVDRLKRGVVFLPDDDEVEEN
ncbi:LOW QUALITY PROTEIN: uncharacterized protein LOC124291387 [Haliotis rubra]|uniref:LOW QUALITY PROTEIN: uncharacterized protein LOC124291387 n=1 Tax=Haliotis rubra TaxID=36100 RepID=UPI001EE619C9|nr:LOW QUALITY PROTEIN: uncharacterized protein LOC124291387 [Haliotis rubra]